METKSQKIPETTDVVVIGAGIAGISAAWYLNKAGLRVVVCEKGVVAGEQSSRNWGWIRQQGRDRDELPIVMESMRLWQEIADELDTDIGFRREGSLYLCENDAEMSKHDRFMSFTGDYGLETRPVNRKELEDMVVDCPTRWRSGIYTPDDGRAEAALAVPEMAKVCQKRGVVVQENCAVLDVVRQNGKVSGVVTELGEIKANAVLVAAGAWSTFLLQSCGVRLPQLTVKASVARTAKAPLIFNGNASGSQISFRRRLDGGYNVASTDRLEIFPSTNHVKFFKDFMPLIKTSFSKFKFSIPELKIDGKYTAQRTLNPIPSAATAARIKSRLADRLPVFKDIELVECWAGMIDALPDVVPVMDRSPDTEGLWISTGYSGHGFGIGPAAGKIMADLIQNKPVDHGLRRFRLSRFSDGSPIIPGPSI
jgi:glycine/D-amino acid oxidase-like deaminating enzyme